MKDLNNLTIQTTRFPCSSSGGNHERRGGENKERMEEPIPRRVIWAPRLSEALVMGVAPGDHGDPAPKRAGVV